MSGAAQDDVIVELSSNDDLNALRQDANTATRLIEELTIFFTAIAAIIAEIALDGDDVTAGYTSSFVGTVISVVITAGWFPVRRKLPKKWQEKILTNNIVNPWSRRFKTAFVFGQKCGELVGDFVPLPDSIPAFHLGRKIIAKVLGCVVGVITGILGVVFFTGDLTEKAEKYFKLGRESWSKYAKTGLVYGSSVGAAIGGLLGTFVFPGLGTALGLAIGGTIGSVAGFIAAVVGVPLGNKISSMYSKQSSFSEYDLSLMSVDDVSEIDQAFWKNAKIKKTPILIKSKDKFIIYGDPKGYGNWQQTEIETTDLATGLAADLATDLTLDDLPFEKGIIKRDDQLFTSFLIKTLKKGHDPYGNYRSNYVRAGITFGSAIFGFIGGLLGTFVFPGLGTAAGVALGGAIGGMIGGFVLGIAGPFISKYIRERGTNSFDYAIRTGAMFGGSVGLGQAFMPLPHGELYAPAGSVLFSSLGAAREIYRECGTKPQEDVSDHVLPWTQRAASGVMIGSAICGLIGFFVFPPLGGFVGAGVGGILGGLLACAAEPCLRKMGLLPTTKLNNASQDKIEMEETQRRESLQPTSTTRLNQAMSVNVPVNAPPLDTVDDLTKVEKVIMNIEVTNPPVFFKPVPDGDIDQVRIASSNDKARLDGDNDEVRLVSNGKTRIDDDNDETGLYTCHDEARLYGNIVIGEQRVSALFIQS